MIENEWIPIEEFFKDESTKIEKFMYMGSVITDDQKTIFRYKHRDTRRYLNLDDKANTYQFDEGSYKSISRDLALLHAYS